MKNTIACIDVGLKRIGLAFCFDGSTILPQNAILRKNRNQAANDVSNILKEWNIKLLVVGIPSDEVTIIKIKHFVSLLDFQYQIKYQNEDSSSIEAKEKMKGEIRQKRDGRIDSIAAGIILENHLAANSKLNT